MKISKLSDIFQGDKIKGHWELAPTQGLQYKAEGKDEEIKFKGSLVAAEPDALVVSYTERQSNQKTVTRIFKLAGTWSVDSKNRIAFEVEKETGKNDVLTFKGIWKVDDTHQIVYSCQEANLKTKSKEVQEILFKGYWDISEKNRLAYYVGGDTNNMFRLKGAFQTKSILAKKGEIKYQVGVEVSGKRKIQTITLFGKWIVSRDLNLSFEIEYEDGKKKAIVFGGEYALGQDSTIQIDLRAKDGKPLGITIILTKDIFGKDGQAFIRLQKTVEESRVEAGMKFKW